MENKAINKIEFGYLQLIHGHPLNVVGNMNFDEFWEWCELGSKEDLEQTLIKFMEYENDFTFHISVIRKIINIKNK